MAIVVKFGHTYTAPLLPTAIVVKFDHTYTGPSICLNDPCCVPIVASTNVSDLHGSMRDNSYH